MPEEIIDPEQKQHFLPRLSPKATNIFVFIGTIFILACLVFIVWKALQIEKKYNDLVIDCNNKINECNNNLQNCRHLAMARPPTDNLINKSVLSIIT